MEGTTVSSDQMQDVDASPHREEQRGDDRVIVVNSQPTASKGELPPRRLRRLGTVTAHATDPINGESRPRRGGGRRGNALLALLSTALPTVAAAFAITFLTGRVAILTATGVLALLWLVGIGASWRGLAPGGRDNRGGVWLGRAIGLVLGAVVAVYLLIDPVSPLL